MPSTTLPRLQYMFLNSLFSKNSTPVLELEPPKAIPPPPPKNYGPYCVHAEVFIEVEETGKKLAKLTGKAQDWDIIPKTVHSCKQFRNGTIKKGYCTVPNVKVVSVDESCTGEVIGEIYQ